MTLNEISEKISGLLLSCAEKYLSAELPSGSLPSGLDTCLQAAKDPLHGDLSSNIAMRLASVLKDSPHNIGGALVENFIKEADMSGLSAYLEKAELKGGFINFRLAGKFYEDLLYEIERLKADYGRSCRGEGKKINIEFVSANPTGPLTIAHGRQAAIGDALRGILEYDGYEVTCEYYLNDVGNQIDMLGESLKARYLGLSGKNVPMPEDGYMGDYIVEMAEELVREKNNGKFGDDDPPSGYFREYAVKKMLESIRMDLDDFRVSFDVWTAQSGIEQRGEVQDVLNELENKGYVYGSEGAKWLRSSQFGDDKDRVVVKSGGAFTYLAPDIAYHRDKYRRGYDSMIDLLGPDHHGYIKRMKAAVEALGYDRSSLDILIVQLVTLMRGGKPLSMSTRKGEFVSLRELLDDIGVDVTRFFFLSRRLDSHLDLDVEIAKKNSSDNPVYYMQYAHARIRSIQKFSSEAPAASDTDTSCRLELLSSEYERRLMRKLSEFPFVMKASADMLEPNRLLVYLNELARCFHSFYTECRVVSEDIPLTKARLFLVECVRIVLSNGLGVLNISLPEKM